MFAFASRTAAQAIPSDARRGDDPIDSLVARALAVSPDIAAARQRVEAARARVGPAGARPDPMLMAGIENQPLGREATSVSPTGVTMGGGPDPMTMRMIGVSQTIPFPGKLSRRTTVAHREVDAAVAVLDDARARVVHDVRTSYYELAYTDRALGITMQNQVALTAMASATSSSYAVGSGSQQDVLDARIALAKLAEQANALREQRVAQLAALNSLLDRPTDAPLDSARIPAHIAGAAVASSVPDIRFASRAFGAAPAGSPLPSLDTLQSLAIANSTMLREHEAGIAVQTARLAAAQRETRPDFDVSLQYGQRSGFPDMITAQVSVPIPIQHARKQDDDVAAARADLAALEAEHRASVNDLRARVAMLYANLERQRTQLALETTAILPQGQAACTAALAAYRTGKTDIRTVLARESTLLEYRLAYDRGLTDFALALADLDQLAGVEVLP
ncbi:MAG TPA: TolC family protein [Gemmatimonadaceae bacterium]|nr:TolC family protein [Gemmatimonadaceae bacterium]